MSWRFTTEPSNRELEARIRQMELEWEEMFDRMKRLLAKISKRAERAEALEASEIDDRPKDGGEVQSRRDQLNQEILARRRGRVVSNG